MGTQVFRCGCSITTDMFSHEIIGVIFCSKHAKEFHGELELLADKLRIFMEGDNVKTS